MIDVFPVPGPPVMTIRCVFKLGKILAVKIVIKMGNKKYTKCIFAHLRNNWL